jgi:predicted CXXCH cytochrome family protein
VSKSCLGCHNPHASTVAGSLLVKSTPGLCLDCHKSDTPPFRAAHLNYPVATADCASCHDPHGSSQKGILWASVHPPVANRMCANCHFDAASPDALKVKKTGLDGCRGCHSELVNATLALNRVHGPILDDRACLNCHRPHASKARKLLAAPEIDVCGSCHTDAVRQARESVAKHAPVADGDCSTCHAPHGSNSILLFTAADATAVCSNCHDWKEHSSHPIGKDVVDPRNKNVRVDCLSCHNAHGSAYKYITWQDKKMDLCVTCHQDFRR